MARSDEFRGSAVNASQPTVNKPITPIAFQPTSVLHPFSQSGTGFSSMDHERKLAGLSSPNGQSQATWQSSANLRFPFLRFGA